MLFNCILLKYFLKLNKNTTNLVSFNPNHTCSLYNVAQHTNHRKGRDTNHKKWLRALHEHDATERNGSG